MDLSTKETQVEAPEENHYRRYIGNGMMAAYYLLTKTPAGIDPLSHENLLMFMSGVTTGLEAPGLARFVVAGKSPLTGGIGEARSEGPFGLALKRTGYDGLVLYGKAEEPSYLLFENGKASLLPATDLWGKTVKDTTDILSDKHPNGSYAVIGPAGENLVRFANVVSDYTHHASRMGMGALMGSKNLKAVVIVGGELPKVFAPEKLAARYDWFDKKMRDNTLSMWQHDRPGFSVWIHTHGLDASIGVNNYQTAEFTNGDDYTPEAFAPYYKGESPCPSCPNNCIKQYSVEGDDPRIGGMHQEVTGSMGPNLGISDISKLIRGNTLATDLGMDPNSLGYTISFALECIENNLLDDEGLNLQFGDQLDLDEIINRIAYRKSGLGNLLAEGSSRAAKEVGGKAPYYSLTVKQNEMTPFEARTQTNLALGFAVAPVGPRYEICEHDWDFDTEVGWDHTLDYCRTLGILERIPMEYLGKKKVRYYKELNTQWSAVDALGVCLFSSAPTRVYSLEDLSELVEEITGWITSSAEIMRLGEKRNQMFRLYNNREGFTKADDMLPDRFYNEPIDFGNKEGVQLDKEGFREMVDFYYGMMGWDSNGKPLEETIYNYNLEELVPFLK